ncbi:hypothetical protein MC53_016570 [Proteus mirabilis]|uniref:hypothetical protein n=1 Tax=Proteus TaxID=583 RepID=UPI00068D2134|nr:MULTISPECIES: hypothetical protein [Proteus]AUU15527.1 hypothetical protein MC53_016570 [Proteus mirabilis]ELA8985040.1 hypothetical protein [Proteus mirabilis]ELB1077123.1 hypothetical protein [Proteus mirabilis]ELB4968648.1 hypothetical protein [Proteus mirabilis]MBG2967064.1 hypothetical protein [Proteus mirabilis]
MSSLDQLKSINLPGNVENIPDNDSKTDKPSKSSNFDGNLILLEDIEDRKADRALREKFGDKAYNVVKKTLYGWAVVLITTAFCKLFFDKEVFTDTVLVAITSAVTLNTFAAFLGVIRGLFPSNRKCGSGNQKKE